MAARAAGASLTPMAVTTEQPPTIPPAAPAPPAPSRADRLRAIPEVAAAAAIGIIWLTVLFDAIWGPDIISTNGTATQDTHVPSAIVVAAFAYLATRVVAQYGFGPRPAKTADERDDPEHG
jgi:hypothetical protein